MDAEDYTQNKFAPESAPLVRQTDALLHIGKALKAGGYRFVAPTPLTYGRVLARPQPGSRNLLVEALGWNRPFRPDDLEEPYREWLFGGGLVTDAGGGKVRSVVRFSTLGQLLFAHSGYPTVESDAVFFGPDTYRFARAIQWLADYLPGFSPKTIIDVGAGTGAGGIFAATAFPRSRRTILADINPRALAFAAVNAALNHADVEICHSDVLTGVEADGDLIVSNPPYLVDPGTRAYRHGGGEWGCALSVRILEEALGRLTPRGRLLLYTGAPVVNGVDMFLKAAEATLASRVRDFRYEEQDPDVFGEELENTPYDRADRIATVVLHVTAADIIR
jgi:SAM-dependent methyltransferase